MSKKFVEKNIKLSLEFDKYISRNPSAFRKIPSGACIVITVKGDATFNKNSKFIAEKTGKGKQKYIEAKKEGRRWELQPLAV